KCVAVLASAKPRGALTLEAQHLPVSNTFGHGQIERAALGHGHPLLRAADGFHEVDVERIADILATQAETWTARAATAEEVREDIGNAGIARAVGGPREAVGPAGA